jgi:hypothetical protein
MLLLRGLEGANCGTSIVCLFAACANPMLMVAAAAREETWNIKFHRTFCAEKIMVSGEFCASLSQ